MLFADCLKAWRWACQPQLGITVAAVVAVAQVAAALSTVVSFGQQIANLADGDGRSHSRGGVNLTVADNGRSDGPVQPWVNPDTTEVNQQWT